MGVAADTGQIKGFLFYTNLNHSSQIRMFKEILTSRLSLIQINMDSKIPLPDWQEVQTQKSESSSLLFLPALLPKVAPALCRARKQITGLPSWLQAHSSLLKAGCFLPADRVLGQTRKPPCPMQSCLRSSCSLWHSHRPTFRSPAIT